MLKFISYCFKGCIIIISVIVLLFLYSIEYLFRVIHHLILGYRSATNHIAYANVYGLAEVINGCLFITKYLDNKDSAIRNFFINFAKERAANNDNMSIEHGIKAIKNIFDKDMEFALDIVEVCFRYELQCFRFGSSIRYYHLWCELYGKYVEAVSDKAILKLVK